MRRLFAVTCLVACSCSADTLETGIDAAALTDAASGIDSHFDPGPDADGATAQDAGAGTPVPDAAVARLADANVDAPSSMSDAAEDATLSADAWQANAADASGPLGPDRCGGCPSGQMCIHRKGLRDSFTCDTLPTQCITSRTCDCLQQAQVCAECRDEGDAFSCACLAC